MHAQVLDGIIETPPVFILLYSINQTGELTPKKQKTQKTARFSSRRGRFAGIKLPKEGEIIIDGAGLLP
jgi:hypothetical protein